MTDIVVTGAEEFGRLAARLKTAAKTIQREFTRALTKATLPLKEAARASARSRLPSSGGLADRVASSRFSTRRRTTGKTVGISITAKGLRGLASIDQGTVRHPTFGNRDVWVSQSVTPGWFSEPMEKAAPLVRRELIAAMDDIANKIEG